jgi:polar amino acid transport system substrate-binding protein
MADQLALFRPDIPPLPEEARRHLAPTGVLRAGINLSNFLLVTGRTHEGKPVGVSPDLARAIADHLGLELQYVTYPDPGGHCHGNLCRVSRSAVRISAQAAAVA